jgi:hypothetical protein
MMAFKIKINTKFKDESRLHKKTLSSYINAKFKSSVNHPRLYYYITSTAITF